MGSAWQARRRGARAKAEDAGSLKAGWAACAQSKGRPQAAAVGRRAGADLDVAQWRCPREGAAAAHAARHLEQELASAVSVCRRLGG